MHYTHIQFGGHSVWLGYDGPKATAVADYLYHSLPAAPATRADNTSPAAVDLRLVQTGRSLALSDRNGSLLVSAHTGEMAERLQGEVCHLLAAAVDNGLAFHAAALAANGRALAFPGMMQHGKSTLAAGLVVDGWQYLTDEFLVVPQSTCTVTAFTRPINLRRDTLELFAPLRPDQSNDPRRLTHPDGCLVHPSLLGPAGTRSTAPLAGLIFAHYTPGATFDLTPLTPAQAGLALMACLVNARNLPDHGFRETTRLARVLPAYRMTYSTLDQPGPHLREIDLRVRA